jgi:hypothetical protein
MMNEVLMEKYYAANENRPAGTGRPKTETGRFKISEQVYQKIRPGNIKKDIPSGSKQLSVPTRSAHSQEFGRGAKENARHPVKSNLKPWIVDRLAEGLYSGVYGPQYWIAWTIRKVWRGFKSS